MLTLPVAYAGLQAGLRGVFVVLLLVLRRYSYYVVVCMAPNRGGGGEGVPLTEPAQFLHPKRRENEVDGDDDGFAETGTDHGI